MEDTMNWSMQLYTARDFQPWDTVLSTIARDGYKRVEGFGGVYADPAGLRAKLDENGLSMPTAHFSLDMLENDFDQAKRIADTLGVKLIICPYIVAEERPVDAAGWHAFGERLAKVGARINAAGYGFAWHNHDFEFRKLADGSLPISLILDAAPELGLEFDVAWAIRGGDASPWPWSITRPAGGDDNPWPWFEKYRDRIVAVHVKDMARPGEGLDEDGWSDVGHGVIDWKALMKLLRTTPAEYYVLEQDKPNDFARFSRRSIAAANAF